MPIWILKLLGSKWTWIAVIFAVVVSSYQITVWSLKDDVEDLERDNAGLQLDLRIVRSNLNTCVKTNKENDVIVATFEDKIEKLNEANTILLDGKSGEITALKKIIVNMKKPVVYTESMENITVEILTEENKDENDTTFDVITNIGS